jgi:hypothetical protein
MNLLDLPGVSRPEADILPNLTRGSSKTKGSGDCDESRSADLRPCADSAIYGPRGVISLPHRLLTRFRSSPPPLSPPTLSYDPTHLKLALSVSLVNVRRYGRGHFHDLFVSFHHRCGRRDLG